MKKARLVVCGSSLAAVMALSPVEEAASGSYAPGDTFRDCGHCPEMVVVPAGTFMMGSPMSEAGRGVNEGPVHEVRIGYQFAVGVYEVTFGEWDACVSGGGCGGYRPSDAGWGRGSRQGNRI